jgi:hypothetical protein
MQGKQAPLVAKHGEQVAHQIGTYVQLRGAGVWMDDTFHSIMNVIGRNPWQAEQKLCVVGFIALGGGQRGR